MKALAADYPNGVAVGAVDEDGVDDILLGNSLEATLLLSNP